MNDDNKTIKNQAQERFGQFAEGYVLSKSHASGDDLERLVEVAQPQAEWAVLDIATGGGHTALRFAPHVRSMVAFDLTPPMLSAARKFITSKNATNVVYTAGDAENLPFAPGSFDLITCRIAPHHFPNCFRFVQEATRVLKPGGRFLVEDNTVPDDEPAARYVDAFERLRDPSHVRMYAGYEWQGMFLDAGLEVTSLETVSKPGAKLVPWVERQGGDSSIIERLQIMLVQAPEAVAAWMKPKAAGSTDASFDHHYVIIMGVKAV